jgi:hypothetical protein
MNPGDACLPSISVIPLGATSSTTTGYDRSGPNENLIVFRDHDWPNDPGALAQTTVSFEADTGRILDADIELNAANFDFTPELLELTLLHEAGHFFGLAHSTDPNSVMVRSVEVGMPPPAALSSDDAQGICAIYPESGERVTERGTADGLTQGQVAATPCSLAGGSACSSLGVDHGCAVTPLRSSESQAPVSFAALGLAYFRIRRRRRAGPPSAVPWGAT